MIRTAIYILVVGLIPTSCSKENIGFTYAEQQVPGMPTAEALSHSTEVNNFAEKFYDWAKSGSYTSCCEKMEKSPAAVDQHCQKIYNQFRAKYGLIVCENIKEVVNNEFYSAMMDLGLAMNSNKTIDAGLWKEARRIATERIVEEAKGEIEPALD